MSSASAAIETPVLIVGGGSVGLALASELGGRGVQCLVLEQNDKPADHPRATALNARSMEFMRRWGVADAVREAAAPEDFPHTALYCTALDGYEIARLERPNHGGRKAQATSPEQAQRCNQIWLDPILCAHVQSLPSIDLRFCWRFEELREDGDHVVATVRDLTQDRQRHVIAQYVIDCSGGHSPIRRAFGITMSGSPHIGYHLSIYVRAPALWTHHDKGKAALINFVEPTGLWRNMVTLDGRELYRFGVRGKEYYDDPDRVDAERLFTEVVGKNVPHEIMSVRRWTARNVVADTYRVGSRIFLAGDAAHLNHPASGLGLNTGLGDATNLGWKLHAVLAGWGGATLLDSYESERRPVGIRNISHAESSNSNDRNQKPPPEIADDTPAGEKARREMGDRISQGMTRKFVTDGLALGYRYAPSSICCDDGTPPPPDSVSDYAQTSYPGSRAPHAWLSDGRSTIDVFGPGFTLLRFDDKARETAAIERGFSQRDVPLVVLNVTDPDVGALYERALVLVRPDGHVAWRSDTLPPDALALVDRVRGAGEDRNSASGRHRCENARRHTQSPQGRGAIMDAKSNEKPAPSSARGPRRKPVVIDFHAHFMTQEVFDATYKLSVLGKLRARAENTGAVRAFPDALIKPMTDLGVRLRAMDKMGVDIQVVSPNILHQCTYALDAEEGLRLERLNNDHVADMVAKAPDRLIGIGSVPLHDTASAIAEMDRLVGDLKLKGVIVASRVNDMELGDARLRPFWKKAEALDIPVFVHPAGNPDPRLQRHSMLISLGQPLEEAFAQTSLIYDGVLDECPNLKIAFAHGGGFIPYYAGRFDWMYRRGSTSQMKADFSTYLQSFYYETVLFNPDILEHLAEKVDASHIMLGSDFPFGEADPVAFLQSARQISEASREAILGANAARFLAIKI